MLNLYYLIFIMSRSVFRLDLPCGQIDNFPISISIHFHSVCQRKTLRFHFHCVTILFLPRSVFFAFVAFRSDRFNRMFPIISVCVSCLMIISRKSSRLHLLWEIKITSISRWKCLPSDVRESALELLRKGLFVSAARKQIEKKMLTFILPNAKNITEKK